MKTIGFFGALLAFSFAALAHEGEDHGTPIPSQEKTFLRGDSTGDGVIGMEDALWTLEHLFHPNCSGYCAASGDFDGDEKVTLSDAISTLNYLFLSGCYPAAPYPSCSKVSDGDLGCNTEPSC